MKFPDLDSGSRGRLYSHLVSWRHEHVFRWLTELTSQQREQLCRQVDGLDLKLLQGLYGQAKSGEASHLPPAEAIRPAAAVPLLDSLQDRWEEKQAIRRGSRALEDGQVAVVLVAGGQGTRLGHDGPKGTFPVGPVSNKSLFQIHAEKVLALSRRYGMPLPLYVMTSPDNDETTREFFADHKFFGLGRDQTIFFQQGMIPVLDRQTGKLLMADKHRIATSPNGHGGVVKALADDGHLDVMRRRGVKYVFYYQVDNPLVKVADPAYLGRHIDADAEMSLKVVRKSRAEEKLGVVVKVDGRLQLIEYSDLPEAIARRRLPDGSLEIWAGSIAVHVFNLSFLERLGRGEGELPHHRAIKRVACLDETGQPIVPAEANAIKFEMFIFDALPLARNALVVETSRAEEFEPLKNASGEHSPASVRRAMSRQFALWLDRAHTPVPYRKDGSPAVPVEISPLLALDAVELRERLSWPGPVNGPLLLDEKTQLVHGKPERSRRRVDRETDRRQRPSPERPAPKATRHGKPRETHLAATLE